MVRQAFSRQTAHHFHIRITAITQGVAVFYILIERVGAQFQKAIDHAPEAGNTRPHEHRFTATRLGKCIRATVQQIEGYLLLTVATSPMQGCPTILITRF